MGEAADSDGTGSKWPRRFGSALLCAVIVYLAIGSLTRLTVRDRSLLTATLYYGGPSILLATAALLAAIGSWWRSWARGWTVLFVFAATAWGAWWWQSAHVQNQPRPIENPLRLVFWNTARGELGMDGVYDKLLSYDADIIGIVEGGEDDALNEATWRRVFASHRMTGIGGQITLLTKGEFVDQQNFVMGRIGFVKIYDLKIRGQLLTAIVVDIAAHPYYSRAPVIRELTEAIKARGDRPVVVVGDFNTPSDSVHFEQLRAVCLNAFQAAGTGHTATWPVPFPVIHIDHVWVNHRIKLGSCAYGWSLNSDHRPIVVEFTFAELP